MLRSKRGKTDQFSGEKSVTRQRTKTEKRKLPEEAYLPVLHSRPCCSDGGRVAPLIGIDSVVPHKLQQQHCSPQITLGLARRQARVVGDQGWGDPRLRHGFENLGGGSGVPPLRSGVGNGVVRNQVGLDQTSSYRLELRHSPQKAERRVQIPAPSVRVDGRVVRDRVWRDGVALEHHREQRLGFLGAAAPGEGGDSGVVDVNVAFYSLLSHLSHQSRHFSPGPSNAGGLDEMQVVFLFLFCLLGCAARARAAAVSSVGYGRRRPRTYSSPVAVAAFAFDAAVAAAAAIAAIASNATAAVAGAAIGASATAAVLTISAAISCQ